MLNHVFTCSFWAALLLIAFSCKKQSDILSSSESVRNNIISERTDADFARSTTDVYVDNGVLCFKDSATLEAVLKSSDMLGQDSAFNRNYLASKGVLSYNSPEDEAFPYDPAYHAFNHRFANFTSLYEHVENQEFNFLANGGNVDDIPEPDIDDDDLQVILNQYKEVKVGNLIYKYIDEDRFFVVTGSDFSRLPVLRALNNPLAAKRLKNAVLIDSRVKEDMMLYDNIVIKSKPGIDCNCAAFMKITKLGASTYSVENISIFYHCQQTDIVWWIRDANGNTLYTANDVDLITYTIPANTPLPVSVFMSIEGDDCSDSKTETLQAEDPCSESLPLSLSIQKTSADGHEFIFVVYGLELTDNYTITWNFGDNTPTVLDINDNKTVHEYDFSSKLSPYLVTAYITWGINCSKVVTLTFEAGCGVRIKRSNSFALGNPPFNGNYKAKVSIKIPNSGNKMVAKIKFYKKNSNGNFKKERADNLFITWGVNAVVGVQYIESDCQIRSFGKISSKPNAHKFRDVAAGDPIIPRKFATKTDLTKVKFEIDHLGVLIPYVMTLY